MGNKISKTGLFAACALALGVMTTSSHAQTVHVETRQLDRAIEKSRALHARPLVSDEQIILTLTERVNAQAGQRYTPLQVVDMLDVTPAQLMLMRRGVGLDDVKIAARPLYQPKGVAKAPEEEKQEAPGGLVLNRKAP